MTSKTKARTNGRRVAVRLALSLLLMAAQVGCGGWRPWGGGETANGRPAVPHFRPGFNLFSPAQDVELGRQSAAQIAREVPLLSDEELVGYVRRLGAKLAQHAPGEKFPYQFQVVSSREVNAFALPGGFIFVNAGTIAAAHNEGELAGVIAHEIMHVALRHGTNQVSKAYLAQAGLGVLGAIAGGDSPDLGRVIESVGGAGANMLFLKFGRTAERQADLGGAQMLAAAGYDPRDLAGFFETLQREGGQRVPEFLSDHPDPGNRVASINEVLPALEVRPDPVRTSPEFERAKARLSGRSLPASAEPARIGPSEPAGAVPTARPPRPSAPAAEFRSPDGAFAFTRPQNWAALAAGEAEFILAPEGGSGRRDGAAYVTHGLFVGQVEAGPGADLSAATEAFLRQQLKANPDFEVRAAPGSFNLSGRDAYATTVAGPSPVTGRVEVNLVYTAFAPGGRLFYLIAVAPEDEFETYRPAFEAVLRSLRLS
ncbi:MAG TPA: M48 family metalloprotease [Pyrinomonadaceae bacterium]|nr:M48 family metalloprotease [Pyrinomonadaceae bacterium]